MVMHYFARRQREIKRVRRRPLAAEIHDWCTGSTAFFHAMCTLLERASGALFLTVNHTPNINSPRSMLQIKFNQSRESLRQKLFSVGRLLLSRQFISGGLSALYGFNYAYFNPPRRHFCFERAVPVRTSFIRLHTVDLNLIIMKRRLKLQSSTE